jgi:class 3 adenylate cyclase/tetratricopeptide (TPR) repeat protein
MFCLKCQHENREGAKYCEACGNKLEHTCPSCGNQVRPEAAFCDHCGTSLTEAKEKRRNGETGNRGKGRKAKQRGKRQTPANLGPRVPDSGLTSAERRQLTVMFCDLVGSTALSAQLDPEELREVVRSYQKTCAAVIQKYEGYVAQYLGDGLLVYFGYPAAHEDDAQRAVRAGLEIITALHHFAPSPAKAGEGRGEGRLQVRIGIHTGLVVIGDIGDSGKREQLALGDTPNIAARLQGLAEPNTVIISAATYKLVGGFFDAQNLGLYTVKGLSTPLQVYRILGESEVRSRLDVAATVGLTPLVGREEEIGLLLRRWELAKQSNGQVVLLCGEAGIGKSRLVRTLRERIESEPHFRVELRCSPYHQNSALYPVVEHIQRVLQFERDDTPEEKFHKLAVEVGTRRAVPLQPDTIPLFASLLSLPLPDRYSALNLTPQRQRQKTLEALLSWLLGEAERKPVVFVVEDLHWIDPSTMELLSLLVEQVPTVKILLVFTFRPEFSPPWTTPAYLTHLTLSRFARNDIEAMVEKVTGGKELPGEIVQQIIAKTDGVPLFVEELTKTVLESMESIGSLESIGSVIPTTLQDALMARLDRLGPAKEIAQFGATLGREFSYEVLQAVSPVDEAALQQGLRQLAEAELLYQRGLPPQSWYIFKHALIQDAAYQSLLRSTRQQYHQQIAVVLEEQFPETKETQPELLAQHYTEAGLFEQAIPYWQRAGQRAIARSAHMEAIAHLTKGLELLQTLPDTPTRIQQELTLQIALGVPLIIIKGHAAPEVERVYSRAQELCGQAKDSAQLFSVLLGLRRFYGARGEMRTADELGKQILSLAQKIEDTGLISRAHMMLTETAFALGEFTRAQGHAEQGIAFYNRWQHRSQALLYGNDAGVVCLSFAALILWYLGYPDRALKRIYEALTLARDLVHSFSLAGALISAALLHQLRREGQATQELAEAAMTVSTEQEFALYLAWGTSLRGWAITEQGQKKEGIAEMCQGLTTYRSSGGETLQTTFLAPLIGVYGKAGLIQEGWTLVVEALTTVDDSGVRMLEAELYRLKGELTLQRQSKVESQKSKVSSTQHRTPSTQAEAEACFLKAIEVARSQHAKSLELRAVTSLTCLWQQQGKRAEARQMLAEIYNWFTEGFDTKDLQEAKALLGELQT